MEIQVAETLRALAAIVVGGLIGFGFGALQDLALRRNQRQHEHGALRSGWAVMPGAMTRVTYLILALVLVQVLCPLLFVGASQWLVSAGVVFGYGTCLLRNLIRRRKV